MSTTEHPRVSKARKAARISSRTSGQTYQQELDNVARAEGFQHWSDMLATASAPAMTSAPEYRRLAVGELKQWEFFGIEIGGYRLAASVSADGPYIHGRLLAGARSYDDGVALGYCTYLIELTSEQLRDSRHSYAEHDTGLWICKYGNAEPRLSLTGLSKAEGELVAALFGIENGRRDYRFGFRFYETPCWPALIDYVRRHPRIAKRMGSLNSYIGDWYGIAKSIIDKERKRVRAASTAGARRDSGLQPDSRGD